MKIIAKICVIAIFAIILLTGKTYARLEKGAGFSVSGSGSSSSGGTNAPTIDETITPDTTFNSIISAVFGVAAYICYGAAVIVVIIKGVKFMNAAPEAKADIKNEAIAVVVGAAITFSIGAILQIIANTTAKIF